MARLENVLPALRDGKHIKLGSLIVYLKRYTVYCKRADSESDKNFEEEFFFDSNAIFAYGWEIVPEHKRVADYLVPMIVIENSIVKKGSRYERQTHPIGQQPDGAFLVPGSERTTDD